MNDLQELYQEVVLDHNRSPRNFKTLEEANRSAEGFNPLCGDQITLYLEVDGDDKIKDIGFQAIGCAISKASASMMTDAVKNLSVKDAENVFENFRHMLTSEEYDAEILGDAEILSGVSQYPARIKCAVLSWHTLKSALDGNHDQRVTSE